MVGVVGVGILLYGVWDQVKPRGVGVEIVRNQEEGTRNQEREIIVDVSGAVEKPGVYYLASGSRIGDALVAAGGLSANADRVWVSQNMNLAKEIKDQEKIYIPNINNQAPSTKFQTNSNVQNSKLININIASIGELDALPGIGSVRAKAIIDNRPYGNIEELVSKAKIPQSVYEDIANLVSVY